MVASSCLDADPVLRNFRRFQHENAITEFRDIDDLVRSHATSRVISAIAHGLPPVQSVSRNSELGLLRYQMELQRPSQSIRDMISKMPQSFSKLAPCMLMSPLSIAQYLPPNQALFDVVIFGMRRRRLRLGTLWGRFRRARQTIIVGDPKQLPPTNFFGRNEEEEDVADHEKDLESILDEAKAAGIPNARSAMALSQPKRVPDRLLQSSLLSEPAGDFSVAGRRRPCRASAESPNGCL